MWHLEMIYLILYLHAENFVLCFFFFSFIFVHEVLPVGVRLNAQLRAQTKDEHNRTKPRNMAMFGSRGAKGASSLLRTCMGSARSLKPHQGHQAAPGQKDPCKAVGRGRKEKRTPWPLRFWRRRTDWLSGGVLSFT